jgi:hypothetical protein
MYRLRRAADRFGSPCAVSIPSRACLSVSPSSTKRRPRSPLPAKPQSRVISRSARRAADQAHDASSSAERWGASRRGARAQHGGACDDLGRRRLRRCSRRGFSTGPGSSSLRRAFLARQRVLRARQSDDVGMTGLLGFRLTFSSVRAGVWALLAAYAAPEPGSSRRELATDE